MYWLVKHYQCLLVFIFDNKTYVKYYGLGPTLKTLSYFQLGIFEQAAT